VEIAPGGAHDHNLDPVHSLLQLFSRSGS